MIDEQHRYIELIRFNQYSVFQNELSVFELRMYDIHGLPLCDVPQFSFEIFLRAFHILLRYLELFPFRLDTLYDSFYVSVIECKKFAWEIVC